MYHKVTLAGNLGRDPEMRYTAEGSPVTNFSVAVDDSYGETKKTIWVRVSAWGKQAESCNQYLHKGSKVLVEGRLGHDNGNPRVFTRNDGSAGASFEIRASVVKFLGGAGEQNGPQDDDIPAEVLDDVAPF